MGLTDDAVRAVGQRLNSYLDASAAEKKVAAELVIAIVSGDALVPLERITIHDALAGLGDVVSLATTRFRDNPIDTSKGRGGELGLAVTAIRFLNDTVRPPLSQWTAELGDFERRLRASEPDIGQLEVEIRWPRAGGTCRSELGDVRSSVRAFVYTLAQIAGITVDSILPVPSSAVLERRKFDGTFALSPGSEPRQEMVRWLSVRQLLKLNTARRLAAQEREQTGKQAIAAAQATQMYAAGLGEEFIFDYVSDLGDAFDPTMAVAWQIGRKELRLPGDIDHDYPTPPPTLSRARLLIMGGDQVYPYASAAGYANQTVLPYANAWEGEAPAELPDLLAVRGNHDYLGGIGHFHEVFETGKTFAGHWQTKQERGYWHVSLPQGWWIWGIDTGLDDRIPDHESEYFQRAAAQLNRGDRVIVCTPVPLWQLRQRKDERYVDVRSVLDPLIRGRGAEARLWLSGDSHFGAIYSRVAPPFVSSRPEDQAEEPLWRTAPASEEIHITAGGGGAFLHPTHNLPETIPVESATAEFQKLAVFPSSLESRRLAAGAGTLRDPRSWVWIGFAVGLSLLASWLATIGGSLLTRFEHEGDPSWRPALLRTVGAWPLLLVLTVIVVAASFTVVANSREPRLRRAARAYGLLLGAAMAVAIVAVIVVRRWIHPADEWLWVVLAAIVAGALATVVFFAGSKWINRRIKANDNLAFASAHSTRFKHFLRFRIDVNGDLTCYFIGLDPIGEHWSKALAGNGLVPPADRAGLPRMHYVWGRTFPKFDPPPITVAISVAGPTPRGVASETESADRDALVDLFGQICRALIAGGHTVLYGGNLSGSFSEQFKEVAAKLHRQETARHGDDPRFRAGQRRHLVNYVVTHGPVTTPRVDDLADSVLTVPVSRPAARVETRLFAEIRDLTAMRELTTARSALRICLGGRERSEEPKSRRAPGVIEEAHISLSHSQPLVVVGGFGGASGVIARQLLGTLEHGYADAEADHYVDKATLGKDVATYAEMLAGMTSLQQLRNGFTDSENRELLTTRDKAAAVELVMRAVNRTARRIATS